MFCSLRLLLSPVSPQLDLSSTSTCWDDGVGVSIEISSYDVFTNPQLGESMIGELGFCAIIRKLSAPMRSSQLYKRHSNELQLYLPQPGVDELKRLAVHALQALSSASLVCSRVRVRRMSDV